MSASQADSSSLLARLHPSHYLSTHLAHDSRPSSSRKPLDFPDVDFNLGPIASSSSNKPAWVPSPSALARHGSTTVICNITPSIVYPPPTASTSVASSAQSGSTLVPSINLTPLSSSSADFKSGAPSNFAQFTTERLFEFLDSSLPFDPRVLDIPTAAEGGEEKEGEERPTRAKWCLFADCTVVGYDGGLLETAMLAITAALRQLWLPRSTFSLDEGIVIASPSDYWPLASHMDSLPLAFSFGIYNESLLACPSSFEADLAQTSMLICLSLADDKKEGSSRGGRKKQAKKQQGGDSESWSLCALHSTGPLRAKNVVHGKTLDDEELIARCLALSSTRAEQIAATLREKEKEVEARVQEARR